MTTLTESQLDEERAALNQLLRAHPMFGRRYISIADCLKCRKIPRSLKTRYMDIYHRNYPTSTRLDR